MSLPVSGMGTTIRCDFCGAQAPADAVVPVQERPNARTCMDCLTVMAVAPERFGA